MMREAWTPQLHALVPLAGHPHHCLKQLEARAVLVGMLRQADRDC
jgi:hypothetical protein